MTATTSQTHAALPTRLIARAVDLCALIPYSLVAFIGRFAIAATFWKSGQTKIEGLAIDIVSGTFEFGLPRLSASAVPLFEEEYKLPLLPPELAAQLAAFSEHLFPLLILLGLATRFSALAARHDPGHPAVRLPGRLPDPRALGGRVAAARRQGAGRTGRRPADCPTLRLRRLAPRKPARHCPGVTA